MMQFCSAKPVYISILLFDVTGEIIAILNSRVQGEKK